MTLGSPPYRSPQFRITNQLIKDINRVTNIRIRPTLILGVRVFILPDRNETVVHKEGSLLGHKFKIARISSADSCISKGHGLRKTTTKPFRAVH